MKLEVLLSTMNQTDYSILKKIKINSDCVIVNQCEKENYNYIKEKNIKFINSKERGLSRSRNLAIKNATADICLLADDDLEYINEYSEIVLKAFKENPYYDIITFQVEGKNKKFKNYPIKEKKLNYITSLKVSSVEIAFRLKSIRERNIRFNEMLGTGSKYCMGEENAFIYECIKNGLKIKYIPIKLADLYIGKSSWFNGFNEKYFFDRGAAFTAMSRRFNIFLIIQFAIRHRSLYKEKFSLIECIKMMLRGREDYIRLEGNCK